MAGRSIRRPPPPHHELDLIAGKLAPGFDFGHVSLLGEFIEKRPSRLPDLISRLGECLPDVAIVTAGELALCPLKGHPVRHRGVLGSGIAILRIAIGLGFSSPPYGRSNGARHSTRTRERRRLAFGPSDHPSSSRMNGKNAGIAGVLAIMVARKRGTLTSMKTVMKMRLAF